MSFAIFRGLIRHFWSNPIRSSLSGLDQCLFYKIIVVRIPVLDQGTLHRLFMRVRRHIDRLHRPRIQSRVVHTGRYRRRCRVEILYLLRHVAEVSQVFRKLHRLFQAWNPGGRTSDTGQGTALIPSFSFIFLYSCANFSIDRILRLSEKVGGPGRRHAPARPSAVR